MLLSQKPCLYTIGFLLFFISMLCYIISISIPGIWINDQESKGSTTVTGRSVFSPNVIMCFGEHRMKWKCLDDMQTGGRIFALVLLVMSVCMQMTACAVIVMENIAGTKPLWFEHYLIHPTTWAGIAATLSYSGLVVYVRYTFDASNISYGPGFYLNAAGLGVGYLGMFVAALTNYKR